MYARTAHSSTGLTYRPVPGHLSMRSFAGAANVTWAIWAALCVALFATYASVDPADLYHVSGSGIAGGASRVLVELNFPIALLAIAMVTIAMDRLQARWWWVAGPALVCCAVTAVPGVVDDADLDARPVNVIPAIGVLLAVVLTWAASRRPDPGADGPLLLDGARWIVGAVVVAVSLPWIFADLGVFVPEWLFIMERPITGADGLAHPAVHLGHHHGLDGALLVLSALIVTRIALRSRSLRVVARGFLALLAAYGAVNLVQDAWNEQIVKRGLSDHWMPSAYNPALEPIWLVIVLAAVAVAVALTIEARPDTAEMEARTL